MITIDLTTTIHAPIETVFDLARNVEAHRATTGNSQEIVVAGRQVGLLEEGETITWEARHLGFRQRLQVEMTRVDRPVFFEDTMLRGAFRSMRHEHRFEPCPSGTLMHDTFEFSAPLGVLGILVERWVLRRYMRRFLLQRNAGLKAMAEAEAATGVNAAAVGPVA